MNLNNCHNQVMVRGQKMSKRILFRVLTLGLTLLLSLSSLAACQIPNKPEPDLTRPPSDRTGEKILSISTKEVMNEEDAGAHAAKLDTPLELYDSLRPGGARSIQNLEKVEIFRVVDGDTLIIMREDQPVRLRLVGIDAPESYSHHQEDKRTHEGESVSRIVTAWLTGRQAYLEFDQDPYDPYDRLLAYLWLDGHTMVNEILVREGLVQQKRYPPNTAYNDYFEILEKKAKEEHRGIWGIGAEGRSGLSLNADDWGRKAP